MEKLTSSELMDAQSASFIERVNANAAAIDATPSVHDYIREFGEERVKIKGDEFEVQFKNRDGSPDLKARHLGREMLSNRWKYEQRAAAVLVGAEKSERPTFDEVQRYLNLVDPRGVHERTYAGCRWRKMNGHWRML